MNINQTLSRFVIASCNITRANMRTAIDSLNNNIINKVGGYICFTNVHASVLGKQDLNFRKALDSSFMTLPDGKPLFWFARLKGYKDVGHVPGPEFLPTFIKETENTGTRHYFYGSTNKVLADLKEKLTDEYPNIVIAGMFSPPFRKLDENESAEIISNINKSKPDVIWVGLGAPKQELWMLGNWRKLKPAVLLGVGAAFDFQSGNLKRAPSFATKLGLEWLYRLSQEPRRLFKRYLITNTLFLYYLVIDAIKG